jgi:hypothetical protein
MTDDFTRFTICERLKAREELPDAFRRLAQWDSARPSVDHRHVPLHQYFNIAVLGTTTSRPPTWSASSTRSLTRVDTRGGTRTYTARANPATTGPRTRFAATSRGGRTDVRRVICVGKEFCSTQCEVVLLLLQLRHGHRRDRLCHPHGGTRLHERELTRVLRRQLHRVPRPFSRPRELKNRSYTSTCNSAIWVKACPWAGSSSPCLFA